VSGTSAVCCSGTHNVNTAIAGVTAW
jgi:hypothetical protein